MEHTDAGAYVGLADTYLPEYAFTGNGDIPPAATSPALPEMALAPPIDGQRRRDHGVAAPPEAGSSGSEGQRRRDHGVAAPPEAGSSGSQGGDVGDPPGTGTDVAGTRSVADGDMSGDCVDTTNSDVTYGAAAYDSASCEPVGNLAEVVDLGLAGLFPEPMEWQERALCAQTDPEAFFPEKGGSTREAKRICSGCEVRPQCLEYALANDERFGIWGGMSERERRKQRRRAV
jgi:WhiB family redox-sensing transcriptional regulator